jgi:hypothetical protein
MAGAYSGSSRSCDNLHNDIDHWPSFCRCFDTQKQNEKDSYRQDIDESKGNKNMKIFLIAICIMSLCIVLWKGISQAVPEPVITFMMILLGGSIIAVMEGLRAKPRRPVNDKKQTS